MSKKLIGVFLGLGLFAAALPASAAGLTQAQIQSILGLLQSFGAEQSVINKVAVTLGSTGAGIPDDSKTCVQLTRNLTIGVTGEDVTRLQKYLAVKGFFSTEATGYYGFVTAQAVGKLQLELGIVSSANDTSYGLMGPKTREAVSCSGKPNTQASIAVDVDGGTHLTIAYKNLPPSKLYLVRDVSNEVLDTLDMAEGNGRLEFNLKGKPAGNYFVRAAGDGGDIRSVTFYISGQTNDTSSATIDQSSLAEFDTYPTFIGSATKISSIMISVIQVSTGVTLTSKIVPVVNGRWSFKAGTEAPRGSYKVKISSPNNPEEVLASATYTSTTEQRVKADLKVNDSDGPVYVKDNQEIVVRWTSSMADRCQLTNVRTSPAGAITSLYHLSPSGSRVLYAVGASVQGTSDSFVNLGCYKGANAEQNPTQANSAVDLVSIRASQTQVQTPSMKILSPNGGESYRLDQPLTLKWSAENIPVGASFVVEFRRQGGGEVTTIATADSTARSMTFPRISGIRGGDLVTMDVGAYAVNMWALANGAELAAKDSSDGMINILQPAGSNPAATIDQSSLSQSTGNFRITGSASNATSLQVIMVTGNYTGATDWNSANAAVRANSVYNVNSTARVENGRWVGVFGSGSGGAGVPAGAYTLLVFDLSNDGATPSTSPKLLTRNTLMVQY
jgi:peptidoglycan hydrolase-like protein with peptidoglycan-binding domain